MRQINDAAGRLRVLSRCPGDGMMHPEGLSSSGSGSRAIGPVIFHPPSARRVVCRQKVCRLSSSIIGPLVRRLTRYKLAAKEWCTDLPNSGPP